MCVDVAAMCDEPEVATVPAANDCERCYAIVSDVAMLARRSGESDKWEYVQHLLSRRAAPWRAPFHHLSRVVTLHCQQHNIGFGHCCPSAAILMPLMALAR